MPTEKMQCDFVKFMEVPVLFSLRECLQKGVESGASAWYNIPVK